MGDSGPGKWCSCSQLDSEPVVSSCSSFPITHFSPLPSLSYLEGGGIQPHIYSSYDKNTIAVSPRKHHMSKKKKKIDLSPSPIQRGNQFALLGKSQRPGCGSQIPACPLLSIPSSLFIPSLNPISSKGTAQVSSLPGSLSYHPQSIGSSLSPCSSQPLSSSKCTHQALIPQAFMGA